LAFGAERRGARHRNARSTFFLLDADRAEDDGRLWWTQQQAIALSKGRSIEIVDLVMWSARLKIERSKQHGKIRNMDVRKAGSSPTRPGSPDYFTGTVWMDPIIEAPEPARIRCLKVRFDPGARTAWHTHPLGQTLYVLSGVGRAQTWGEPVRELRPGDTIWIPPGEKHWHGAAPTTGMEHMAFQESLDGSHIEWLEQVPDDVYEAPVG